MITIKLSAKAVKLTALISYLTLFFAAANLYSVTTTGANFLKFGIGARACAMGEAYVALADDVNAVYWNPAGLAYANGTQLSMSHVEYLETIRHENVGLSFKVPGGVLGISGTYLWVDGLRGRASGISGTDRVIPVMDGAAAISYGLKLSKVVSFGLSLKGIYQQLDDKVANGIAGDAGLIFKLAESFKIGMAAQNYGMETAFVSEAAPLPSNFKLGFALNIAKRASIVCDGTYGAVDNGITIGSGTEIWLLPIFCVRAGYKYNNSAASTDFLTAGSIGGGLKFAAFNVDYAAVPFSNAGYTHKVSIITKF